MAINGVQIYGNSDAEDRNAYTYEGSSFDTCYGHPNAQNDYHYHIQPAATSTCGFVQTAGQHSPLFGFMADGIPIYGPLGDDGIAPTDLDYCGGHTDTSYSYYHYHLANDYAVPYTVNCLRGCIFSNLNNPELNQFVTTYETCGLNSTQYDYSSLASWAPSTTVSEVEAVVTTTSYGTWANVSFLLLIWVIVGLF